MAQSAGRLRAAVALGAVVAAAGVAFAWQWSAAAAAPDSTLPGLLVTPAPASGPPSTTMTLRGTGYGACPDHGNRRVNVLWDGFGTGVSVPIGADGTFTASLSIPADASTGDHLVYGQCVDGGDWARAAFTVNAAPPPARLAASLSPSSGGSGDQITVRGTGYETCPDFGTRRVNVLWDGFDTGVSAPIGSDGTFTALLRVAADAAQGEHLIYGQCVDGGEWATATFLMKRAEIRAEPSTSSESTTGLRPTTDLRPTTELKSTTPPQTGSTGTPPTGIGTPPTPSAPQPPVSSAIAQPRETGSSEPPHVEGNSATEPWRVPAFLDAIPTPNEVWDFLTSGRALALLPVPLLAWFLIGWPAELFNTTYRENEDIIRRWLPFLPSERPVRATSWPIVIAFAGIAAVLVTAVQLDIKEVEQSVPVAVGYFIAIPLVVLTYEFVIEQRLRAEPGGGTAHLRVIGTALILALACAAASRHFGFQPGYAYGLLLGYTVVRGRDGWPVRVKARAILRGAAVLTALAACAWLFWQFGTRPVVARGGASDPLVALDVLLAQTVMLSLETLVIGLIPVRFLHGAILRQWSRRAWLAVYAVVCTMFVAVLIRWRPEVTPQDALRSFWLFVAFCGGSVLFWAVFAIRARVQSLFQRRRAVLRERVTSRSDSHSD